MSLSLPSNDTTYGAQPDTAELLQEIAAGDRKAFERLLNGWSQRVHQIVLHVLRDPAQTEEVVQEIFLEIWLRADTFHAEQGSASGFLLRLSRSRAIDRVRASQTQRERILLAGTHDHHERMESLSRVHDDWAVAHDLYQSLSGLTLLQRESVELVFLDGLSHAETADRLGVPVGTVKSRVFSALARLRKHNGVIPAEQ